MQITTAGMIYMPILIFTSIFGNYKQYLKLFILISAFTTVEVINIGENGILAYHIAFVLLFLKYLIGNRMKLKIECNLLTVFVFYAALTIPLSLVFDGIEVRAVDGGNAGVRFSFQQITQFVYLFIAFVTYCIIKDSIRMGKIHLIEVERACFFALAAVVIIGYAQKVLPIEFINKFFRNSVHAFYNFLGARISSTFSEPSMLALFATPLIIVLLYSAFYEKSEYVVKFVLFAAGVILLVISESSTFIIGTVIGMISWIAFAVTDRKPKFKTKSVLLMFALLVAGGIVAYIYRETISDNISGLLLKITVNESSYSGIDRMDAFTTCCNAFFESYMIGVGWGTLRSTDLFSTVLAEVGLIGNIIFYSYTIKSLHQLWKNGTYEARTIFMLQCISLGMLLISVPEMYFFFIWIYWAMGDALVEFCKSDKKIEIYGVENKMKI